MFIEFGTLLFKCLLLAEIKDGSIPNSINIGIFKVSARSFSPHHEPSAYSERLNCGFEHK